MNYEVIQTSGRNTPAAKSLHGTKTTKPQLMDQSMLEVACGLVRLQQTRPPIARIPQKVEREEVGPTAPPRLPNPKPLLERSETISVGFVLRVQSLGSSFTSNLRRTLHFPSWASSFYLGGLFCALLFLTETREPASTDMVHSWSRFAILKSLSFRQQRTLGFVIPIKVLQQY
jgi:hypothetical protein